MKTYLAVYMGTAGAREASGWDAMDPAERAARERDGMQAWTAWMEANAGAIVDTGGPLGVTKRISPDGVADIRNAMAGYVVIQASSHEEAAEKFKNHPHFAIFPGECVEVMERLPIPGM